MKKNKAIAVLVCMALLLGLLTFTAAVGFGPTGTGSAKNIITECAKLALLFSSEVFNR